MISAYGVQKSASMHERERGREKTLERTVVGHGKNRNLRDRSVSTFDSTSSLVDGRQISVHVSGISTSSRNLLSSSRYLVSREGSVIHPTDSSGARLESHLSQSISVRRHICQDDEHVLLELVGVVLGRGQCESRSDNPLNAVSFSRSGKHDESVNIIGGGKLMRLTSGHSQD